MVARFFVSLTLAVVVFAAWSCSTPVEPNNSIYSVTFHAGAPVDSNYSKDIVETHLVSWTDSATHTVRSVLKFYAIGRCGCGALTDQFYLVCDTSGAPSSTPSDSGSLAVKIQGDVDTPYSHGNLVADSLTATVTGYALSFSGYIIAGHDSITITNGKMIAPPVSLQ